MDISKQRALDGRAPSAGVPGPPEQGAGLWAWTRDAGPARESVDVITDRHRDFAFPPQRYSEAPRPLPVIIRIVRVCIVLVHFVAEAGNRILPPTKTRSAKCKDCGQLVGECPPACPEAGSRWQGVSPRLSSGF